MPALTDPHLMPRLTAPRLITAWAGDCPTENEEQDEWRYWESATSFGPGEHACSLCDSPLTSGDDVAAVVVRLFEDNRKLMHMRFVCRCCAPDDARARAMAAALVPETMGGAA